ncbi:tape measure protein [Yersinia pseudotuberculosis]|uniref:tape measure protein n=1 Tax=Yersinia pseudotuberculosis TaxID=633 RepID=UPI0005DFBA55|nr:tape measure protein [Yersinia pseudotuberculosis]CND37999.1 tape measure domain [Yersinia pseudotuberculosis]CQH06562.1 tape measure domain [Yersinia pseudotuberculosis]
MPGENQLGNIVYNVEMNLRNLIESQRQVDDRLNRMEDGFDRNARSASNLESGMNKLASAIKLVIAATALRELADMVQKYQEMSERVQMATSSQEEFEHVQQRLLNTANGTYRALSEAQELYISTAAGLRSMGYATEQTIDVQDSMSYAFVKNATSADRAKSAISAFTKSINTGKVSADQWESITSAIPSVIDDIASASKKSAAQIRSLGASGKLTASELSEGLRQSLDANAEAAAGMSNNLTDASVRMKTAITEVLVALEKETEALQSFTDGLITAADAVLAFGSDTEKMPKFVDAVTLSVTALIAVMGGRFVGALVAVTAVQAASIKSTIQGIIATRTRAKEELAAASVTQRKAMADRSASLSALEFAQIEYQVARGSAAEAIALENVIRLRAIYVQSSAAAALANNALSASQAKVAATGLTMANAMTALKAVTAPLGGPIGVVAIVAAGWYLYAQRQEQARKESVEFANTLPDVISKLKEMNLAQAQGVRADTVTSIKNQKDEIADLESHIASLNNKYNERIALAKQMGGGDEKNNGHLRIANELANDLAKANRDLDSKTRTLANSNDALRLVNTQVNQGILDQMKAARDNALALGEAEKKTSLLGGSQAFLAQKLGMATEALKGFNAESLKVNWGGEDGEKLIKQTERRLALSKLEGQEKAKQQALYDAEDAKVTDPLALKQLQDGYVQIEANAEAKKTLAKETKSLAKEENAAATEAKNRAKQLTDLGNSIKVTTLEMQGQSRAAAQLAAVQKLGINATPKEIALAREQAGAIYDLTVQIENMHKAKQGQQFAQQEITSALSPAAQIDVEEQAKLAKLAEYQALDTQNTQIYEDAKTAIQLQASQKRQEILDRESVAQIQAINSILGAASQGFDGISGIIDASGGKASGAFKAMFAMSKGFAVAQAALNLQMAISQVMADPTALTPAQKFANYAAIASAGGAVLSSIGSISYGGARKNGGGVNADSMYQVGEGGEPELLKASNGKQYMIPGDNGKVISNKDMQGGGGSGGTVVQQEVHFHIETTNGIDDATMQKMAAMMKTVSLNTIKDQQRPNGLLRK